MIRAFIFDMDGTLVETEMLKAQAYALALQQLLGLDGPDKRAIAVYRRLTGNTDETVARALVSELELQAPLRRTHAYDGAEPWLALHRMRVAAYSSRVATPEALRANAYPHTIALLGDMKAKGGLTAVATSSYREEAVRVLTALRLSDRLDVLICRDDVSKPKPDPEIYLLAMERLGVAPRETLIVEDSPVGLAAAVASGACPVCVANEFSRDKLMAASSVDQSHVVYDAGRLEETVELILARARDAPGV